MVCYFAQNCTSFTKGPCVREHALFYLYHNSCCLLFKCLFFISFIWLISILTTNSMFGIYIHLWPGYMHIYVSGKIVQMIFPVVHFSYISYFINFFFFLETQKTHLYIFIVMNVTNWSAVYTVENDNMWEHQCECYVTCSYEWKR